MITFLFLLLTFIDFSASIIIFTAALNTGMRLYPAWYKIGLILASFGLLAQGIRNVNFIFTGVSPSDSYLPFWVLKDLGIATIAFFYFYRAARGCNPLRGENN